MSESGEIIRRLVEAGANFETIGQAVGRNRSLIRQVGIGSKPGHNLRDALAQLETRLAGVDRARVNAEGRRAAGTLPPPAPRTNRRGALAKVRRPTTIRGRSWTASTVRRQAVQHGARGLGHPIADAAEHGQWVAATVTFDRHTRVESYGSSRRGRAGLGGSVDIELGEAEEVWRVVSDSYGGDVTAYILDEVQGRGLVSGDAVIVSIDLRTYSR